MKIDAPKLIAPNGEHLNLVRADVLLKLLFPDQYGYRPSRRWLDRMKKKRIIPHYKLGHGVFYDPVKVQEALERKNLVRAL